MNRVEQNLASFLNARCAVGRSLQSTHTSSVFLAGGVIAAAINFRQ